MQTISNTPPSIRKPAWLKMRIAGGPEYAKVRRKVDSHQLHTVCESAKCPNLGECWSRGTATFMILGDICTRSCGFCAVKTGRPTHLDLDEPSRIADAVLTMGLKYAVITSVARDELTDGGASIWKETILAVREKVPDCKIETLIPDFKGSETCLNTVLEAQPDVLNHNVETVPRLHPKVRPQARYARSLEVLARAKKKGFITKTSIMLGLGETTEELKSVFVDLVNLNVDILTLGQYLQPSTKHLSVAQFLSPQAFNDLGREAKAMGFKSVVSGPLVRSSYHAEESYQFAL